MKKYKGNRYRRWMILPLSVVFTVCMLSGCGGQTEDGETNSSAGSETKETVSSSQGSASGTEDSGAGSDVGSGAFADGDYKDVTSETADAQIALSGSEGTISDTTRGSSGSQVTITSKGIYRVSGSGENVTIVINDDQESGNVYLILDNVVMANKTTACILVEACDKLIIQCVGKNSLTLSASDSTDGVDGVIYAKDDVTINGSGTLALSSGLHGIVCKNDVKITGSALQVNAESIGIQAGDSVRIGGGTIEIVSNHDGIQVSNDDGDSFFYMNDGKLSIQAGYDGIDVGTSGKSFTGSLTLAGGETEITAGGGSSKSKDSSTSQKGLKCDGDILITAGTLDASCADDAIHSDGNITVQGGTIALSTSDDGMTAADTLTIDDGQITVTKSYEGLEAETVTINGGEIQVYASDDGINAAGGSDTSSTEKGPWASSSETGTLNINGGNLYVNADGDGLDSNGSIFVTGGYTIVEGPTGNDNGALDKGDGSGCVASITGGTVLALGSTGMAVNFDSGSQCCALVTLSGSAEDTITVNDGSNFSYKTTKSFQCAVYSSPSLKQGSSYTITAGSNSAEIDFSSSLYYSNVSAMGGGPMGGGGPTRH